MVVWILMVIINGYYGPAAYTVQDIKSAESCEQLAKVVRAQQYNYVTVTATCAPVRKVQVK